MAITLITMTVNRSSSKETTVGFPTTFTVNVYDAQGKNLAYKEARILNESGGVVGLGSTDINGQFTIGNIVYQKAYSALKYQPQAREPGATSWISGDWVTIKVNPPLSEPEPTPTPTPQPAPTPAPAPSPTPAPAASPPSVSISSNVGLSIEVGATATLSAVVSGGTPPYKFYNWVIRKPDNSVLLAKGGVTSVTQVFDGATGNYGVTLNVTDSAGQTKGATATVTLKAKPTSTAPPPAGSPPAGSGPGTPDTSGQQQTNITDMISDGAKKVEDLVRNNIVPFVILLISVITIAVLLATKSGQKVLAKVGAPIGK